MIIQIQHYFLLIGILFPLVSFSQDTLDFISNPSFEDEPRKGLTYDGYHINEFIDSWFDCGLYHFPDESEPDIHSEETDYWRVKHSPSNGMTFLSLVVRDNGSWESITQRLKSSLTPGVCYQFTIDLSKTHRYLSNSRLTGKPKDYIAPAILKIWIGDNYCDKSQLIYKSPPIGRNQWQSHNVSFQANSNFEYITIQATFIDKDYPQCGNILLDNISQFIETECKD